MANEIQEKIDILKVDLAEESEKYGKALLRNAGFDERRAIRSEIREIETEIKLLKEKLKCLVT